MAVAGHLAVVERERARSQFLDGLLFTLIEMTTVENGRARAPSGRTGRNDIPREEAIHRQSLNGPYLKRVWGWGSLWRDETAAAKIDINRVTVVRSVVQDQF